MDGVFYSIEKSDNPKVHLLRFYSETEYVIAKTIFSPTVEDLAKELRRFDMKNHQVIGEPDQIYVGAFLEGRNSISFKIANQISNPADTWVEYDLFTCKGTVVSENELRISISSKMRKTTIERIYKRAATNSIGPD